MTVDEARLRGTTNAKVWAEEFMAEFGDRKEDIDEDLMIGWFANAIEIARPQFPSVLDGTETLEDVVFVAIGAASTCWGNLDKAGVFDSARAKAIGDELIQRLIGLHW